MERKIISDSFERMLKEKADEFRMYPSARVWHSIYNNTHPSRKWPSVTMSIVLISILLLVGYKNSNVATNQLAKPPIAEIKTTSPSVTIASNVSRETQLVNSTATVKNNTPTNNIDASNQSLISSTHPNHIVVNGLPVKTRLVVTEELSKINKGLVSVSKSNFNKIASVNLKESNKTRENLKVDNYLAIDDNAAIETISADNATTTKKEDGKFGWQVYASPSVVYSNASENNDDKIVDRNDINNSITQQKPSIGLEVGASVQYALLKKLKLKTGLQLNYTSYTSPGYQNFYLQNTNGIYPATINNETYQVSLPVGVELKLFGKENLHWDIGATIQPSYLIGGGNAYFISSGKTASYINESAMRNNWNLNAGFETFITYKINGLTWQVGPQFRYQFTSSYNKSYTINENLTNYGLKLGVSKVLK